MKKSFPGTGICSSWHAHKHTLQSFASGMLAKEEQQQSNPRQMKLWLGPTLWFFSSTHVYSYSYQSTGFVSLTRQDLICSTCELPIPHDWSYLCHYQSTTLPAESYWAFLFYMEKDCCKWHYKFCLTFISFSATTRADQACWHRGHLQVLLLPGEGVGKALHRLWFVLSHLGLDGLRYLLNYWVDLFQKTMGLIDLIHLRGKTKEQ